MVQHRWPVNAFFVGVICFMAAGVSMRNGVGWILHGTALGPLLFVGYPILFPLNIYRTPSAKYSGMTDLDKRDPTARQLVTLMRSAEARRFLFITAARLSGLLFLSMALIYSFRPQLLSWNLTWNLRNESFQWLLLTTFLFSIATLPIFAGELLLWSFQNWERRHSLFIRNNIHS